MEGASCGVVCQHPCCWSSGKIEMIEAYRRLGLLAPLENVPKTEQSFGNAQANLTGNNLSSRLSTGSLPTLKVVNLLESDLESDDECPAENNTGYYVPVLPASREASLPFSSLTSRDLKASRVPKAPCASPSPSFSSLYLKRLRQKSKAKWKQKELKQDSAKTNQTTYIHFQDVDNETEDLLVPYLVWVPSKKKKKRRKCKSADFESASQVPKVSVKHITGSDSDFGFLATPYNQENAFRSHSRATHTVRSSPNRMYPRRLAPITRDDSSSKRSGIQLLGDGLLKDFPTTPKNTPASIRPLLSKIEKAATNKQTDEPQVKDQEKDAKEAFVTQDEDVIDVETDGTFVIQNGKPLPVDKDEQQTEVNPSGVPFCKREELQLPRVTLPKDKLKQLPIENHCKNSIPSHGLHGIQMQPIEGTGATPSRSSTASLLERLINEDVKYLKDSLIVEAPLSDQDYLRLIGSEFLERKDDQDMKESLLFRWEASEEMPQAPAPTPASPLKKGALELPLQSIDAIKEDDVLAKEESQNEIQQSKQSTNSLTTEQKPKNESNEIEDKNRAGSPVPSKASVTDWPSDKDIMKQTYEKYRSFTPFKSPGVSLLEARLDMIKETNSGIGKAALNALLMNRGRALPYPFYNGLQFMHRDAVHPRPRPTVTRSLKNSGLMQRRANPGNITEINVSTMNPFERKARERYNRIKAPFRVDKMSLMDPTTKPKHDHIPSYEIYEAKFKQDNPNPDSAVNRVSDANRDSDQLHIIIPVPNSTPCELAETVSEDDIAVNNGNGTLMIINDNSVLEKIKEIDRDVDCGDTSRNDTVDQKSKAISMSEEDIEEIHGAGDICDNGEERVKDDVSSADVDSGGGRETEEIDKSGEARSGDDADNCCEGRDLLPCNKDIVINEHVAEETERNIETADEKVDVKEESVVPGDEDKQDDSQSLQLEEGPSSEIGTNETSIEIKVENENGLTIQNNEISAVIDDDDLDAIIEKSSFNDFDVDSIPDLTSGLDMSLNLSEEIKRAMLEVSDVDSENGDDS